MERNSEKREYISIYLQRSFRIEQWSKYAFLTLDCCIASGVS